jgi:hypothetical protein
MIQKAARTILIMAIASGITAVSAWAGGNFKFLMATGQIWQGPYLNPPEVVCIGGTYDPNSGFCTPGTRRTLLRNARSIWNFAEVQGSAASMFQGEFRPVVNCNLNKNLQGECWGTFEAESSAGGKWEGTWCGKFDLVNYIAVISAVGHGDGGDIDGMQMKMDAMSPGGLPYFTFLAQAANH